MDIISSLGKLGGMFRNKHFVLKSGKHADGYINFDVAFTDFRLLWDACTEMVKPFFGRFDLIVVPAVGGIALGYTACSVCYTRGHKVNVVWADKVDESSFVFERAGFAAAVKGKRVLVLDDVMTNPDAKGTVYKLCRLVETHGGKVVGVSIVCNRCGGTSHDLRVPQLRQLSELNLTATLAEDCPLCKANPAVPIVADIGHGAEYAQRHPDYPGKYMKVLS